MADVFARRRKGAVSAVVGTILMVAVTVVLAAVLYTMVSGLGQAPAIGKPNVVLQPQSWNAGQVAVNVEAATGATVNPVDLTYLVTNRTGTTCYSGAANFNLTLCGVAVNLTYQDSVNGGKVGSGDSIRLTVYPASSPALLGGRVRLFFQGGEVGAATLP